jgi:uncharacterized protein YkwD
VVAVALFGAEAASAPAAPIDASLNPPTVDTPSVIVPTPTPSGCADADARHISLKRLQRATLCLINSERRSRALPALHPDSHLRRAAAGHARDMVRRRYFAHGDVLGRISHSGYLTGIARWRVGENLGWGWGTGASPRAIVRTWMGSAGHRRNILAAGFSDVGVALASGSPAGRKPGAITYVVDFGGSA